MVVAQPEQTDQGGSPAQEALARQQGLSAMVIANDRQHMNGGNKTLQVAQSAKLACVAGAMANGIGAVEVVEAGTAMVAVMVTLAAVMVMVTAEASTPAAMATLCRKLEESV